jgi:hypothetical protein
VVNLDAGPEPDLTPAIEELRSVAAIKKVSLVRL